MKKIYFRISESHGKNVVRVAVAREILKVIYHMLRDNRPFIKED